MASPRVRRLRKAARAATRAATQTPAQVVAPQLENKPKKSLPKVTRKAKKSSAKKAD